MKKVPEDMPERLRVWEVKYECAREIIERAMDLTNIPLTLQILADILREDTMHMIKEEEPTHELSTYAEQVLCAADDLEYCIRRRFTLTED